MSILNPAPLDVAAVVNECTLRAAARGRSALPDLAAALGALLRAVTALGPVLEDAQAVQWEAPRRPAPREDTTERSAGGPPSDPAGDTALDPVRLRLRAEVRDAERVLASLPYVIRHGAEDCILRWVRETLGAADSLHAALGAWRG